MTTLELFLFRSTTWLPGAKLKPTEEWKRSLVRLATSSVISWRLTVMTPAKSSTKSTLQLRL